MITDITQLANQTMAMRGERIRHQADEAKRQWTSMSKEAKAALIERYFKMGEFHVMERLSTIIPTEELTEIIGMLPQDVQMLYVNYINNTATDKADHIVTGEDIARGLECCTNVALVYIINAVSIEMAIGRMMQAWDKSDIVNRRLLTAINTMCRTWKYNDDMAVTLSNSSVMPIIWQLMNALRFDYEGSGCFVDDVQYAIKDDVKTAMDAYYDMCGYCKNDVSRYAFIVHSIMASSLDEIKRRYNNAGTHAELTMKQLHINKVDVSGLKKIMDNALTVAQVASNYSVTNEQWKEMRQKVTEHLADVYRSHGNKVIEALQESARNYYSYYFGVMVYIRRNKIEMPEAIKSNCRQVMKSKAGYSMIMKEVKKLDLMTQGDDNPYSIGNTLLDALSKGEKFRCFEKILKIKIKEAEPDTDNKQQEENR